MILRNLLEDSLVDFVSGKHDVDDYVALSVMTDGLKATRDTIIGMSGVDSKGAILFTILFNVGNPEATAPYHGVPIDTFKTKGCSPQEGYEMLHGYIEDKYLVVHSNKFVSKFLSEFTARHNVLPIANTLIGTEILYKALRTPDTIFPSLQEDMVFSDLMSSLTSLSYSRNIKAALDDVYHLQTDDMTDYVGRLPIGVGNAFKVGAVYRRMLASPLVGI